MAEHSHEPLDPDNCFNCWMQTKGIDGDVAAVLMSAGFLTGWEKGIRDGQKRGKAGAALMMRILTSEPDITVQEQETVYMRAMMWCSQLEREHDPGEPVVPMSPEVREAIKRWGDKR